MPSIQASLGALKAVADQVVTEAKARAKNEATTIALVGELGAGKTTFTQVLGEALGVDRQAIRSPSFVLQKTYPVDSPAAPFKRLIHIDCYRLDSADELRHIRWSELLADPANIIVVEWADKIESHLPTKYLKIEFTVVSDTKRLITWRWVGIIA